MSLMISRAFALSLCLLLAAGRLPAADLAEQYHATADKLIDAALADTEGYNRLTYLCYRIGNRLSGSPGLEKAIAWSVEQMKAAGLSNVRVIPAKVPHWVRGAESARMVAPSERPLHMLGLGMSIGTPPGGITADVVAVSTFEELTKLGKEKVQGKIVLYNEEYRGYGPTRVYRATGAARAAAFGAVAALVRSATPLAMQIPHTGEMNYDEAQPKIPAAAVSPEDAMMLASLAGSGVPVKVHLEMSAQTLPDADSGDVIGEIPGREHPEEVVVMGGHIDSWDVGQGAQDDGASIMACLQAVALMKKLGLQPRRTIRVAFWVNEENGGHGGIAYRDFIGDKIKHQVAAIEMDGGAEAPRGFGAGVDASSMEMLRQIARLLDRIGAGEITAGGGGSDIGPLMRDGVPGLGERTVGTHYFDWHHTEADTLDKVSPEDFRKNVAALAVMGYALADMPGRLVATPVASRRGQ
uniref:Carboxypeptidase Q n=1 Tax=Solibacter usitatus (strain Ellin6076) TaxID=234267 RepID=Q024Z2_SOLUE